MKTICLVISLLFIQGFAISQKFTYERGEARSSLVTFASIAKAQKMSQLMPDYPAEYFSKMIHYEMIELVACVQGKTLSASNSCDDLSQEQKLLLKKADLGSDVFINIKFTYKDAEEDMRGSNSRIKEMQYVFMLSPEKEAQFKEGYPALTTYLQENLFEPVSLLQTADRILNVTVSFVINELGELSDLNLIGTTSFANIDKLLMESFQNMPNWKAAEDANGKKVKQVFTLKIKFNSSGC